ncbi:hypothetical protein TWF594_001674 [Orbilia oligospora]|nr:hypothetical protein TWF594_001674 [Orbilia oligospora]
MASIIQLLLSLCALFAVLSQALPVDVEDRELSPPKDLTIDDIVYGGTGCPQGSASVQIAADGKSFTARFKSFSAELGTGSLVDSRKFCQLNLALKAPVGWQYAVLATNFTGAALLGSGTKASHTSTVYFSGSTNQTAFTLPLYGAAKYIYNIQAASVVGGAAWSPCGSDTALNIKSELSITGTGAGEIIEFGESGKLNEDTSCVLPNIRDNGPKCRFAEIIITIAERSFVKFPESKILITFILKFRFSWIGSVEPLCL